MPAAPQIGDIKDIVVFGLLFVVAAALANGLSVTPAMIVGPLKKNIQLTIFSIIGNFIALPALVIGFLLAVDLGQNMKVAFGLLALVAGAPFVAWMTSLGKGNIGYGAAISFLLMILTVIIMPLLLPTELRWMKAGVSVSSLALLKPLLLFLLLPLVIGLFMRWRHPQASMTFATYLGPLSVMFLVIHIALMFATYWSYFIGEFGAGDIAFTFGFAIIALLIGYILSPPYILSPMRSMLPQHYGTKLAAEIGTAQKGSQPLICSLIFAFGHFPVAGVMALASSVITIMVIIVYALESGKAFVKRQAMAPAAVSTTAISTESTKGSSS